MATITKLAINLAWDGKSAEDGLQNTAKKTKEVGEAAKKTASLFGSLGSALKGANDIKGTLEMAKGAFGLFVNTPIAAFKALLTMGAELQTTQIRMGVLAGSFNDGAASLEKLRQTARDFGAPLADLVAGFTALRNNGISNEDSTALLRTFSSVGAILGEGGVGALATSVATMAKSGVADLGGLKRMADSGLNVFEELGKRIGTSAAEAEDMVTRGSVRAVTAIHAMQAAANSPEANAAKELFANSLDGQLARMKEQFTALFADIGLQLITQLNLPGILNVLRGVIEGVQIIVSAIGKTIGDSVGQSATLEDNFKAARDFTITLAEVLVSAAMEFAKVVNSAARLVNDVVDMRAAISQSVNERKLAEGSISNKEFNAEMNRIMNAQQEKKIKTIAIEEIIAKTDAFFKKLRQDAKALDDQRAADKLKPNALGVAPFAAVPGNANGNQIMPEPVVRDAFSALRDLKVLGGNATGQVRIDALAAIEAMRGKFNKGPSDNFAARVDANTAAAQEAILRNRGGGEANAVDQLRELIEMTKRDMAATLQKQDQLIDAVRNQRLVIPAQKL